MQTPNRRVFLWNSAALSLGFGISSASSANQQTEVLQGGGATTQAAKHTSDVRLTHKSPVISRIDDRVVGLWVRAAPRKTLKNVNDVEIILRSLDVNSGLYLLDRKIRLTRNTSFIARLQYPCALTQGQQELSVYFNGEQIKVSRISV